MRQGLFGELLVVYLAFLHFATFTVIHNFSRAFAKQNGKFLSFAENLADSKRKFYEVAHFSLSIFFQFFTSLFTFYDIVRFSLRCKSCSFSVDWNFSRLQHPWYWLRSCLKPLGIWKLNLVKISSHTFPFFPTFSCYSLCFHFWKVSTHAIRPKQVFLVLTNFLCHFPISRSLHTK